MRDTPRASAKDYPGAEPFLPRRPARLDALAQAAQDCRGCNLFERATQAVFGAGNPRAEVVLVGEQPGDVEDRKGQPFVGPAGRILARALDDAGIPADVTYLTNAVKHFRWRGAPDGGKRRIHQKPDYWQVRACQPWLMAEIERVDPHLIVALGATAGQALFGGSFRVGDNRGTPVPWSPDGHGTGSGRAGAGAADREHEILVIATIHPSAVLRARDRDSAYDGLVDDLKVAARSL